MPCSVSQHLPSIIVFSLLICFKILNPELCSTSFFSTPPNYNCVPLQNERHITKPYWAAPRMPRPYCHEMWEASFMNFCEFGGSCLSAARQPQLLKIVGRRVRTRYNNECVARSFRDFHTGAVFVHKSQSKVRIARFWERCKDFPQEGVLLCWSCAQLAGVRP